MIGYIPMKLEDDSLAQELLEEYIRLLRSIYPRHGGQELRVFGDEFLLEFPASIEATLCSIELQKAVTERNADKTEDRKIQVRVGIHSGEVVHKGDEVTGEAIDIVSRVERLAGPGGICITENVYRRVRNKIGVPILKFGRGAKKDIRSPIDVYRMIMPWERDRLSLSNRFSMAFQHTGYRVLTSIGVMLIFVLVFFVGYLTFSEEVESGEPIPIAVVDIVNQTGEKELDGLSGMLITALEQSRRLSVLTRSRMFDVLKQLDREDRAHIDESLGKEICKEANLDALVIASIRKFGNLYTIDLKVLDPVRDEYLFTTKEEGEGQESIPSMMDRLSERTRIGLKEKAEEILLTSRKVAEVTTPNLEAYQHYFQGEQYINRLRFKDARNEFRKAIALDSTFALAQYRLAYAYGWEGESIAKVPLQKAIDLIDRIPEKERYYVRAEKARLEDGFDAGIGVLREMEELYPDDKEMIYNIGDWSFHKNDFKTAFEYLEKVLEMDPAHERALQHLAWTYGGLGQLEEMGETARRYTVINEIEGSILMGQYYQGIGECVLAESKLMKILEKEPEHETALMRLAILYAELGRYDKLFEYAERYSEVGSSRISNYLLGFAYLANGNERKALKKLQKSRELDPEDYDIPVMIAYIFMKQGYYDKAREEFETMIQEDRSREWKEHGYEGLLHLNTYLGRYREALRMGSQLVEIRRESNDTTGLALEHLRRCGLIWEGWKDSEAALEEIEKATLLQDHITGLGYWGGLSYANVLRGNYEEAKRIAEERMSVIKWFDPLIQFLIYSEKDEFARAVSVSGQLLESCSANIRYMIRYYLAVNQLELDRLDDAIESLRTLQEAVGGDTNWALYYPRSFYILGRVYEKKGEFELARDNYDTFLEIWVDADEDLPDLIDARERLSNLESLAAK
jgi:tetratricopeptide (TPR) repeat protein